MRTSLNGEPWLDEYRQAFDNLSFSPESKRHLSDRLFQAADCLDKGNLVSLEGRRGVARVAASVAATLVVLSLGATAFAAVNGMSPAEFAGHLFGAGQPATEIVDKMGRPIAVAQSCNGVTVSADAILGDAHSVAVIFTIARDDGQPLGDFESTDEGILSLGFSESIELQAAPFAYDGAYGESYFFDQDPADNAIQLVETRSCASDDPGFSLVGQRMTAHLADLRSFGTDGSKAMVAQGAWELSFELAYEDASVPLYAHGSFDELSVSPIGLYAAYTRPAGTQAEDALDLGTITVGLTDGSSFEVAGDGGGSLSEASGQVRCEKAIFFDRIVNTGDIEHVIIDGKTFNLCE